MSRVAQDFTPIDESDTCFRCGGSYQKTGGFPQKSGEQHGVRDYDLPCQSCAMDDYYEGRETVRRKTNE